MEQRPASVKRQFTVKAIPELQKPPESPERREPDWSALDVVAFSTREHHQTHERSKLLVDEAVLCHYYVILVKDLLARSDIVIDNNTQRNFQNIIHQLQAYNTTVRHQLQIYQTPEKIWSGLFPVGVGKHIIGSVDPDDSMVETDNIRKIDTGMNKTSRPRIISLSDSHVTTAYTMKWLEEQRLSLDTVGVLSFDHHTDLRPVRGSAKKANVMTHLLEESRVGAVAIIGYDPNISPPSQPKLHNQQLDVISGARLYTADQPNVGRFLRELSIIMTSWKKHDITSVYTTVDLDGLRLPEQLYTATDYNPLDNIRQLLDLPAKEMVRDRVMAGAADLSTSRAQDTVRWLQNYFNANKLIDYNGVPASWVARAMRMAREQFGMQIGITRPGTEQRIVGDIVEYTPPDYQNRTARITKALLGSMVNAAS
ncbi:MAG: hypothetical protein ACD_43C00017G0005 [uncultured bacterium]|nr:MAG: hypothetical protein ACD_43C00017G0005 [uncultured bacterium]